MLNRWPVVQHEAAKHLSLIALASIYPPKGAQFGRLISLDDAPLARHVFVEIVGYPDDILKKLRQLHYLPVKRVDEPPRKRVKATGSFADSDPVCASSATSVACGSCAARCVSCEAGCTCTEWDMTNFAELARVPKSYRLHAALYGPGANAKLVEDLRGRAPK